MRKIAWLLLIFILFTLSGCSKGESVQPAVYGYPMVTIFDEEDGSAIGEETVLMKSYEEYQDFLERMMEHARTHDWFLAKLASYPASNFKENMLAFIGFERSDFGDEFRLKQVTYEGKVVKIELQGWTAGSGVTNSLVNYGIIVELPKEKRCKSIEYTFSSEKPSVTRTGRNDKIFVTDVGDVLDLSYAEIAERLNDAGRGSVSMKIVLSNSYQATYHIPSEVEDSSDSALKKLAEQYRTQVEEHYAAKNQEVMEAQDLTGLDITYTVDAYMPWVYVEFPTGITESDVELLHKLTRENRQISLIVLSPNRK